jgi:hypothetical protein
MRSPACAGREIDTAFCLVLALTRETLDVDVLDKRRASRSRPPMLVSRAAPAA